MRKAWFFQAPYYAKVKLHPSVEILYETCLNTQFFLNRKKGNGVFNKFLILNIKEATSNMQPLKLT